MLKTFIMPLKNYQTKYLIDSNSYFRLAQSIHPLLNVEFGDEFHCLYILKECDQEYARSSVLQNKFNWVTQEEFVNNRKIRLTYSESIANGIENNIKFIKIFAKENYLNISDVDIKYLATALEIDIILITDDNDMILTAIEFGIRVNTTLQMLKLMLDCNHITIEKVREIADYWVYINDTPKNFKEDCKILFKIEY
jgi:hypothetical protein